MSKPCPFPLPPGLSYDGPWPGMKPPIHQFTDRAETKSTFGVYLKDFNAAGVERELRKMRAKFKAAEVLA